MTTNTNVLAWLFCADKMRDGRPVPTDGKTLKHDGPLVLCESGLHASVRLIDALRYAPGYTLCRVECGGEMVESEDKFICRERTIIQRIDARPLLRAWARWCALQVIDRWDAPDVVREYLTTGDELKRAAAWAAARAAARATAWDAAWAATWAAARAAAWDAAWAATWAATWDSVGAAASAAAWDAAWDSVGAATLDAQSGQLERMAEEALAGRTEWVWEADRD